MRTAVALVAVLLCIATSEGYRPLRPQIVRSFPRADPQEVGEPLFLTPFIQSGDIDGGQQAAQVDSSLLVGLNDAVESYSGFLTVDEPNNGNMFFWFFPAEENPETAPVVIWLQGGPGGSSMFGALKLHGPIITTVDEKNNLTGVEKNPNSWGRKHNMIYIDNPVGAGKVKLGLQHSWTTKFLSGFSFSNKMPEFNDDVTNNLYEFLQQWYQLFPKYQVKHHINHINVLPR